MFFSENNLIWTKIIKYYTVSFTFVLNSVAPAPVCFSSPETLEWTFIIVILNVEVVVVSFYPRLVYDANSVFTELVERGVILEISYWRGCYSGNIILEEGCYSGNIILEEGFYSGILYVMLFWRYYLTRK